MHEIEKLRAIKYQMINVIKGLQQQTRLIDKQIKELLADECKANMPTN
jgi:hypothetical protein